MTIKSGIYYKYLAQRRTSTGQRGIALHLEKEPFMLLFDDMFYDFACKDTIFSEQSQSISLKIRRAGLFSG